jgi:hypothetical protein
MKAPQVLAIALGLLPVAARAGNFFTLSFEGVENDIKFFGLGVLSVLVVLSVHEVVAKILRLRLFRSRSGSGSRFSSGVRTSAGKGSMGLAMRKGRRR